MRAGGRVFGALGGPTELSPHPSQLTSETEDVDVTSDGRKYKENGTYLNKNKTELIRTKSVEQLTMTTEGAIQKINPFTGHIIDFTTHTTTSNICT
jgi:hypothetical protein